MGCKRQNPAVFADRRFRPRPLLTLFFALIIAGCLIAGIWQLGRADQKQAMVLQHTLRMVQPPGALDHWLDSPPDEVRYQPVFARGVFQADRQFRVGPQRHNGRVGYHWITPLRTHSDRWLLVDRGWAAETSADAAQVPAGEVTVTGWLRPPRIPGMRLSPVEPENPWAVPWVFEDLEWFAALTRMAPLPFVLQAAVDAPGALVSEPPPPPRGPEMHYGYMVQWFAFALIGIAVWVVLSLEKRSP